MQCWSRAHVDIALWERQSGQKEEVGERKWKMCVYHQQTSLTRDKFEFINKPADFTCFARLLNELL
jgi:hypothetical protein